MFVRGPLRRVCGLIESLEQTKHLFATVMIMHMSMIVLSLGSRGLSGKGRQSQRGQILAMSVTFSVVW